MDAMKAVLPDMVSSRVEDLYNAQLSDEEVLAHMADMKVHADRLLDMVPGERREGADAVLREIFDLAQRVRRSYVDLAYRQGLRDGFQMQSHL
jgi:hypothetical protein